MIAATLLSAMPLIVGRMNLDALKDDTTHRIYQPTDGEAVTQCRVPLAQAETGKRSNMDATCQIRCLIDSCDAIEATMNQDAPKFKSLKVKVVR